MILLLSDLHGRYELVNRQVAHAEAQRQRAVEAILVLGDLGLFEPGLHRFFRKRGERFARPLFFIEGNHEDYDRLDALIQRYADVMTHLPRGTVRVLGGRRLLGLGGAAYMDAHTTQMGAVIGERDIERCLAHPPGSVDALVTHDCPPGLPLPINPGFEGRRPPGFEGGQALARHLRPARWFFGHHHVHFRAARDGTEYHGLPEATEGYYLWERSADPVYVAHPLACTPTAWERFWNRLR